MGTLHDLDDYRGGGWKVALVTCRECGKKVVLVFPEGTDPDRLECSCCRCLLAAVTHWVLTDGSVVPRLELVRHSIEHADPNC